MNKCFQSNAERLRVDLDMGSRQHAAFAQHDRDGAGGRLAAGKALMDAASLITRAVAVGPRA